MLRAIGRTLGLVPLSDIQAALEESARTVAKQTAAAAFPAWQLVAEPFQRRGIDVTFPGAAPITGDMRRG